MKTHLLALACAGAVCGAAHAQSNLAVYGALGAGQLKRIGALGFKDIEELGPGLKALVGIESGYEPDSGTRPLIQGRAGNPFSIAGTYQDANENTTAWVVGANYTLAAGTVLLGYGRKELDGAAARQLSIGYAYPLSKRSYLYADASGKKATSTVRQFDIGVRASF